MADNFGLKIGLEGEKEFKKSILEPRPPPLRSMLQRWTVMLCLSVLQPIRILHPAPTTAASKMWPPSSTTATPFRSLSPVPAGMCSKTAKAAQC